MRTLFYLPGAGDLYFGEVAVHLIRAAARGSEVHVASAPRWRGTGVSEAQLMQCVDLPEVRWHILGGEDHPSLRTEAADPGALVDFVRDIDPDYVFCRSADTRTPRHFPGKVRFLMEGAVPPFRPKPHMAGGHLVLDGPRLYDIGMMPPLDAAEQARLATLARPTWDALRTHWREARPGFLTEAGLPRDRRIIALPLNYEGPGDYFRTRHCAVATNAELVADVASRLPDDCLLVLTEHPLNLMNPNGDRDGPSIDEVVAQWPDKVRLLRVPGSGFTATTLLIRDCDGMILRESKAFGLAAFFGKPILRISRYESAGWLNAYTDLEPFLRDIGSGKARSADPEEALVWFGFHYGNDVLAAQDPYLTLEELVDRIDRPIDPARWDAGLYRWF